MEDSQTEARFSLPLPLVPFLGWARPLAQPATAQDSAQTSPPLRRGPGLPLPELAAPLHAGHSYPFPSTYGVGLCNTGPSPRVPRGVMSIFVSLQHLVSCPAQTVQTGIESAGSDLNCPSCPRAPSSAIQPSNDPRAFSELR